MKMIPPLRQVFLQTGLVTRELSRQPAFLLTTLLFPSIFFWFFAGPHAESVDVARLMTVSFMAYAMIGVVMFQFGVGVAQERGTPWSTSVRLLPGRAWAPVAGRILAGAGFGLLSAALVLLTAKLSTPFQLDAGLWMPALGALLTGAIPFGALGLLIGYTCSPKTALPIANLIYLPLSFAGGLWIPPEGLPKLVREISTYLPTRFYGEWMWATVLRHEVSRTTIIGLTAYTVLFFALALVAYRREEQRIRN